MSARLCTPEERDVAAEAVLAVARRRALRLIVGGHPGRALYEMTRAVLSAAEVLQLPADATP